VIVYVTPQQQRWLREHVAPGRTLTDVVLDALEAHQERLTPPSPHDERPGLFARSSRPAPQPGVQVQLRMTPSNVDVLDRLVDERGFSSRSALIRAALAAAERN
jgi:Arc/MetJ-type ribon-helix-helix transcriptional regulator